MAASPAIIEGVNDEQVVVFRLESERYGLDIFRVNEIIRTREITPIPHTEPSMRGLVNLRGKTIPVVDLRIRFGTTVDEDVETARIIVVEADGSQIGLVVDEVCEVCTIPGDSIEPPPSLVEGVDCIHGVTRRNDQLVALLDLDRTLGN